MMTRLIAPLHEGHAPVMLHLAFDDALDAFETWKAPADEPAVEFEGRRIPVSSVFGRMRNCTDFLPVRTIQAVEDVTGLSLTGVDGEPPTYGSAAVVLRALAIEKLKG